MNEFTFKAPFVMPVVSKARLYPQTTHMIDISAVNARHCINTESTFFVRTRPP